MQSDLQCLESTLNVEHDAEMLRKHLNDLIKLQKQFDIKFDKYRLIDDMLEFIDHTAPKKENHQKTKKQLASIAEHVEMINLLLYHPLFTDQQDWQRDPRRAYLQILLDKSTECLSRLHCRARLYQPPKVQHLSRKRSQSNRDIVQADDRSHGMDPHL